MSMQLPRQAEQRGSALIIALLIAAIVSMLSVRFAESFMLQVDQADAQQQSQLINTYVTGAEQLAAQLLIADASVGPLDHAVENWAQQIPPLPTDNGWLQVELRDAQALFNLNNLAVKTEYADDAGAPLAVRFSPAQKQFIRLLQSFAAYPLSESDAIMMTEALIDWIDSDDRSSGQGGAESLYYSSGGEPMQAANELLTDISELHLVRHFTPALVEQLRPWVVVLPEPGPLNLNTAPFRLLATINRPHIMQGLMQGADGARLQAMVEQRDQQPLELVADFFQHSVMQTLVPDAETNSGAADLALFSTGSQWFHLHTQVVVNGRRSQWLSLIARDEQGATVWSRKKLY